HALNTYSRPLPPSETAGRFERSAHETAERQPVYIIVATGQARPDSALAPERGDRMRRTFAAVLGLLGAVVLATVIPSAQAPATTTGQAPEGGRGRGAQTPPPP